MRDDSVNAKQINLDVLALNNWTYKNSLYRWWNLSFLLFSRYRSHVQDALNGIITLSDDDIGTYLHITLPRELRTSTDGKFPLIPNRWLVIRTVGTDNTNVKAVVIESDCPGEDGSQILFTPDAEQKLSKSSDRLRNEYSADPVGKRESMKQVNLGKVFDLAGWLERAEKDVFLTASENGDIMFSAYCFRNRNILSYFDRLTDVVSPATVNFYVVGWLSSDTKSPLYFASSTGIKWDREGNEKEDKPADPYFNDYDSAPVNVAVGANTNEAYFALLERKLAGKQNADKILAAFEALIGDYTADLEKPNAAGLAATHRHTARFSAIDTAMQFYEASTDSKDDNGDNIDKINSLCDKVEYLRNSVFSGRESLWLDFWRYHFFDYFSLINKNKTGTTADRYAPALDPKSKNSVVSKLMDDIEKLSICNNELGELLKNQPNVRGNLTKRYYKPLSPGIIISGVTSPIDIDPNFDYHSEHHPEPDAKCIIPGTESLPPGVASVINRLLTEPGAAVPHKQPFAPIYAEWQSKYVNIPYEYWEFDGFQYNLKNGVKIEDFENREGFYTAIGGISPLSGHFKDMAGAKLAAFAESLGKEFPEELSTPTILSQDMSGFTEAIAQRDVRPFGTPDADGDVNDKIITDKGIVFISNLLGFDNDADHLSPSWFPMLRNDGPKGTPYFDMRCGGFSITDLLIYDKFGRKIIFVNSTQETGMVYAKNYPLIIGDTMRGQKKYALLTPAFLMDTTLNADIKLICFITHNIVNESLMFHSCNGEYLGEITVTSDKPVWIPANSPTGDVPATAKTFIDSVTFGGINRFLQICRQIGKALSSVGEKPSNLLQSILGRSLAMIDVKLSFGFYGKPYRNINWADDGGEPDYWSYKFPFALGDPGERGDGFVAAFTDGTAEKMTLSGAIAGCSIGIKEKAEFTAICVPDTFFTVRTGLLPAFKFRLPDEASRCTDVDQRIDINNALVFMNGSKEQKDVYLPAQSTGSELSFANSEGVFPVAKVIKDTAAPIVTDGTLLRKQK